MKRYLPLLTTFTLIYLAAAPSAAWAAELQLSNPYIFGITSYKGAYHVHTSNSYDGKESPKERVTDFQKAGYDFIAITEHSSSPESSFKAHPVTGNPAIPGMLYFYGSEMSAYKKNAYHFHLGAFNLPSDWDDSNFDTSIYDGQQMISNVREVGGFTVLNHPNEKFQPISVNNLLNLKNYDAIEVWNSLLVGTRSIEEGNAESKWDEVLSAGKKVWGVAGDDCHRQKEDLYGGKHCQTSYLRVNANKLTRGDVVYNLKKGNYYFGYTPQGSRDLILNVAAEKDIITATANVPSQIEFIGNEGQVLLSSAKVTQAEYQVQGNEKYVRIRAASGNSKAWSNPLFLTDGSNVQTVRINEVGSNASLIQRIIQWFASFFK